MTDSNWFYSDGTQQQGPYSFSDLQNFVKTGQIKPDSLVWHSSMTDWKPAREIEGLVDSTSITPPATTPPASGSIYANNPYAPPATQPGQMTASQGDYQIPYVKRCSFPLYLGLVLGGFIAMIAAFIIAGVTAESDGSESTIIVASLIAVASFCVFIGGLIYGLVILYRAWVLLQAASPIPSATPGTAIGFLFIPFFNLYWIFVAYRGWSVDWMRIRSNYSNLQATPEANESIYLVYCITSLIPYVNFLVAPIFNFMCISNICSIINTCCNIREQEQASGTGPKLY